MVVHSPEQSQRESKKERENGRVEDRGEHSAGMLLNSAVSAERGQGQSGSRLGRETE